MTSSMVTPSGKTLGSRHNSHNNLVASDNVSDWLNGSSHNNTPKGPTIMNAHDSLHRQDSFASLTDGFDIVSPPMLTWSNTAESKMGLNNADDYLSNLVEHSIGKCIARFLLRRHSCTDIACPSFTPANRSQVDFYLDAARRRLLPRGHVQFEQSQHGHYHHQPPRMEPWP